MCVAKKERKRPAGLCVVSCVRCASRSRSREFDASNTPLYSGAVAQPQSSQVLPTVRVCSSQLGMGGPYRTSGVVQCVHNKF